MRILGLSFGFHDSAAALVVDGQIVAAAQEERFSRIKNDSSFPYQAINYCLEAAESVVSDLDLVAYHEDALLKFDRVVKSWVNGYLESGAEFESVIARWLRDGLFDPCATVSERLKIPQSKVIFTQHHLSHAASAFFASPFAEATVVTLDGVGEYETATVSVGRGCSLEKLVSWKLPHSLGLFYSAFTSFLGFKVNEGEYKVMGMAAFGTPVYLAEVEKLLSLTPDGGFEIDQSCFSFGGMSELPYTSALCERFGEPRKEGAPFAIAADDVPSGLTGAEATAVLASSRRFADIAASVQTHTENAIRHVVDSAIALTGIPNVALAGGVALNSLANGRLIRDANIDLFVQPAAGDAGCALGAALYHWHQRAQVERALPQRSCSLGRAFPRNACFDVASTSGYEIVHAGVIGEEYLQKVAGLIADGAVVGWFHGRSEWGPRALGHRSILADPRRADNKRIVNEKVKFREPFRPFAPAVPADRAGEFFELPTGREAWMGMPESFMLAVHHVRPDKLNTLPATTHFDKSARVQMVFRDDHPVFYDLLVEFGRRTDVPVLLNTSFNLNGEPIVDSPLDALRTFASSGLDYLCMEGIILSKRLGRKL